MHDKWPSTYELLFKEKPNYRNLYSMFLVAYVKRFKDGFLHRKKYYSQSIKEMLVGDDIKSDGKLFYVPRTKSIIWSSDYKFNLSHPSGPVFGLKYDGGIQIMLHVQEEKEMHAQRFTRWDIISIINHSK